MRRLLRRLDKFEVDLDALDLDSRLPADLNEDSIHKMDPMTVLLLIQIAITVYKFWKDIKES